MQNISESLAVRSVFNQQKRAALISAEPRHSAAGGQVKENLEARRPIKKRGLALNSNVKSATSL